MIWVSFGAWACLVAGSMTAESHPRQILAIFALEEVVGVDDEQAMYINAVSALDPSPDVRVAVMHAVSSMSTRGSSGALDALSSGCTDPSDSVCGTPDLRQSLDALSSCCTDTSDSVLGAVIHTALPAVDVADGCNGRYCMPTVTDGSVTDGCNRCYFMPTATGSSVAGGARTV